MGSRLGPAGRYAGAALAAVSLFSFGCADLATTAAEKQAAVRQSAEFTLAYGETRQVAGTVLRVTFADVSQDSRCPTDVVCVWAGNAVVEVGVAAGSGPTWPLRINSTTDPRHVDWNGVRVSVLGLEPQPRSDTPIQPQDYRVTLRLEPAA